MEEFIITNWLPLLIIIISAFNDVKYSVFFAMGCMIFGTDNLIWLWVNLIIVGLSTGTNTYQHIRKKEKPKDTSNWEM